MEGFNFSIEDTVGTMIEKVLVGLHELSVSKRRIKRLSQLLLDFIPQGQTLNGLDVGCGSGEIARQLEVLNSAVHLQGVEVLARPGTLIKVTQFDGIHLPFPNESFDFIILVDVLHHTNEQEQLLSECARVARRFVLIKDHYCQSRFDKTVLSFMDWFANWGHSVALPYNYLSRQQWSNLFDRCKLRDDQSQAELQLYPPPFSAIFDRHLHFICRLSKLENSSLLSGVDEQV